MESGRGVGTVTDHTAAMRGSLTPQLLRDAAGTIEARHPNARLIKNHVGDLCILADGEYVGHVALIDGEGCWWLGTPSLA